MSPNPKRVLPNVNAEKSAEREGYAPRTGWLSGVAPDYLRGDDSDPDEEGDR